MIYSVETGSQLNAKYNLYNSNQSNCNRAISYYYATRRRCGERRLGARCGWLEMEIEVQTGIVLEGQNPER